MEDLSIRPRKYRLRNYETDDLHEVTKEIWEAHQAMMQRPILRKDGKPVGKIMVFGTAGDMFEHNNLEDLFMNPEKYKLIKYDGERKEGLL